MSESTTLRQLLAITIEELGMVLSLTGWLFYVAYSAPPLLTKIALFWQPYWLATIVSIGIVFGLIGITFLIAFNPIWKWIGTQIK